MGGFGLSPSEFWRLHPTEFWWLVDSRKPAKRYGSMTEDQVAELYEDTYGDRD
ncbi:MAG: phage tail assembly chaperone [Xanthobacteraceae bacterium]